MGHIDSSDRFLALLAKIMPQVNCLSMASPATPVGSILGRLLQSPQHYLIAVAIHLSSLTLASQIVRSEMPNGPIHLHSRIPSRSAPKISERLSWCATLGNQRSISRLYFTPISKLTYDHPFCFMLQIESHVLMYSLKDLSRTIISGLEEASFRDKVGGGVDAKATGKPISISSEVDRVYTAPPEQVITVVENGKPRFEILRDMLSDVVVWNPWSEKAKGMADFGPDDGYKGMVCVEAGSVSAWNSLEAGDAWEGGQRIKAL